MEPKILKTEAEYQSALSQLHSLMHAKPGTRKAERLELWCKLVEDYENAHYPIDAPDPVTAILFRMEQEGIKPKDMAAYLGGEPKVSEILSRKRPLTLSMIRKLHRGLGIPAEALLSEQLVDG